MITWILKVFGGSVLFGLILACLVSIFQLIATHDVTFGVTFRVGFWIGIVIEVVGLIYQLGENFSNRWDW